MVSNGFPNVTTSGQQYNVGEKPSVILYTYINLHAGTPKPQFFLSVRIFGSVESLRMSHVGIPFRMIELETTPGVLL